MIQAKLIRTYYKNQTLGQLFVYEGTRELLRLKTLELPWKDNQRNISCIPEDEYDVHYRYTVHSKFKYPHFHIQDVPDRSWVLIHKGNFNYQIQGCILVGTDFKHLNDDEDLDIFESTKALNKLLNTAPSGFKMSIESLTGEITF